MARIIDIQVDGRVRSIVAGEFRNFDDLFLTRPYDRAELSARFGVQPITFDGWCLGRGQPVPKSANGKFAFLGGSIPHNWRDRLIAGLGLSGHVRQRGMRGTGYSTYVDTIGEATLAETIDRVREYIDRTVSGGDIWFNTSWRRLLIEDAGSGRFTLSVSYETGISDQDDIEN